MKRSRYSSLVMLLPVIAATLFGRLLPTWTLSLATIAASNALVALGIVVLARTGNVSFGQWALVGVGAFATADLSGRFGVPFLLTVPLVVIIGMAVSLLIGLPALRIKGLYLAVVTLTFSYAAELFVFRSEQVGGDGLPELGVAFPGLVDAPRW